MSRYVLGEPVFNPFTDQKFRRVTLIEPSIPDWVCGASIEWFDTYVNDPALRIHTKVPFHASSLPKIYHKQGYWYISENLGYATAYYHNGPIVKTVLEKRWRSPDGTLHGTNQPDSLLVEVLVKYTSQQKGFGGTSIPCQMEDGTITVLCGPWAGTPPPPYISVYYSSDHMFSGVTTQEVFLSVIQELTTAHVFVDEMSINPFKENDILPIATTRLKIANPKWDGPKWLYNTRHMTMIEKLSGE